MKLGTVESLKFKKLKLKLGLAQWQAIGLLESLWMFTARNAPLGDIGKHSNEDIAVHLEWSGDPDSLIDILVECRWIDRSDEHRLLIHDWSDHLPMWLQGNLKRHKKSPIREDKTSTKQPNSGVAQAAKVAYSENPAIFSSDLISSPLTASDLSIGASDGAWLTGPSSDFEAWWTVYPRRSGKNAAWPAWQAATLAIASSRGVTDAEAAAWLLERTRVFAASAAGSDPVSGGDYRPAPAKWLETGKYDDDDKEWRKPNGDGKRIAPGSGQVAPGDDNRF